MDKDLKTENESDEAERNKKRNAVAVLIFVVFTILAWSIYGNGGTEKRTASTMNDIYAQVATDAVKQYEIAERQGDKMQTCVQAGLVAQAYLQAQNESSYNNWKMTEKYACIQAGLPQ